MTKKQSARDGFSIGDRVVYHPLRYGNVDIDGREGTVIYIDGTECPYTVLFDEPFAGGLGESRSHLPTDKTLGRCYFAKAENLSKATRRTDINLKKESETDMDRIKWTPELEEQLLSLKAQKKTNAEIAYALGTSISVVKNRLIYIKTRSKPKEKGSSTTQQPQKGELNDLEQVLSETVRELTAERDRLADALRVYEKDYAELLQKNEACISQVAESMTQCEQLRGELKDMQEALARTEEQLDEERAAALAHLDKVTEQVKTISALESRVFNAESDLLGKDMEIGKLKDKLDGRDAEIDELTGRLERAAGKAGELLTQCLLMGE